MRTSHHPVREGKMGCASCHNPHDGTQPEDDEGRLGQRAVHSPATPRSAGPFLWEHAPVRENCVTCHDPHGSNHEQAARGQAAVPLPALPPQHAAPRHALRRHATRWPGPVASATAPSSTRARTAIRTSTAATPRPARTWGGSHERALSPVVALGLGVPAAAPGASRSRRSRPPPPAADPRRSRSRRGRRRSWRRPSRLRRIDFGVQGVDDRHRLLAVPRVPRRAARRRHPVRALRRGRRRSATTSRAENVLQDDARYRVALRARRSSASSLDYHQDPAPLRQRRHARSSRTRRAACSP